MRLSHLIYNTYIEVKFIHGSQLVNSTWLNIFQLIILVNNEYWLILAEMGVDNYR